MNPLDPDFLSGSLDPEAPATPPKILITEDEYIVAFDLQVRLKNMGYDVVGLASSGDDAILQAQDKQPDLVLMDIMLHGDMDGVDAAQQIRESCDIPVIFITANADNTTLQRAGATHPFSCLLKPFKERELKFTIDMALYHHRTSRRLRESRDGLEKRVAERTAELAASNHALQRELEQHRRTLAELREAQRVARSADHAKNEFLATVSHELLTPMNAIVGMVEILLENAASPVQREQLRIVQASSDSLLSIINDLLDLSRIENGTMEFDAAPFDVRDQFGEYLRPYALRAKAKGLAYDWSIAPEIPQTLVGDAVRIGQVLANLAANAVKFTEKGRIEIQVTLTAAECRRVRLKFSVADTGIGVPEEKQKVIFEPFVQADNSLSRRYGGAGLGLSISSRIVSMLGGSIEVNSKPQSGSIFHFELWLGRVVDPA